MKIPIRSREGSLELVPPSCRENSLAMKANGFGDFFGNPGAYRLSSHFFQIDFEGSGHGFINVENVTLTILTPCDRGTVVHEGSVEFFRGLFLSLGNVHGSQHSVDRLSQIGNFIAAVAMDQC